MWAIVVNGEITQTFETPRPVNIKGVGYPKEVFFKWTPEELRKVGIYEVRYSRTEAPEGQKILKQALQVLDDHVLQYDVLAVVPKEETMASLDGMKLKKQEAVRSEHLIRINEGLEFKGRQYSLLSSMVAHMALRIAVLNFSSKDTTEFWWFDIDNREVPLTREEQQELADEMESSLTKWILNEQRHLEQIGSLSTAKEVEAYDTSTGW